MSRTLSALPGMVPASAADGFEIGYTTEDGAHLRVPLADADAVRFGGYAAVAPHPGPEGPAAPARALVVSYRWLSHRLRVVAGATY